jgi:hypothetical protein
MEVGQKRSGVFLFGRRSMKRETDPARRQSIRQKRKTFAWLSRFFRNRPSKRDLIDAHVLRMLSSPSSMFNHSLAFTYTHTHLSLSLSLSLSLKPTRCLLVARVCISCCAISCHTPLHHFPVLLLSLVSSCACADSSLLLCDLLPPTPDEDSVTPTKNKYFGVPLDEVYADQSRLVNNVPIPVYQCAITIEKCMLKPLFVITWHFPTRDAHTHTIISKLHLSVHTHTHAFTKQLIAY